MVCPRERDIKTWSVPSHTGLTADPLYHCPQTGLTTAQTLSITHRSYYSTDPLYHRQVLLQHRPSLSQTGLTTAQTHSITDRSYYSTDPLYHRQVLLQHRPSLSQTGLTTAQTSGPLVSVLMAAVGVSVNGGCWGQC